MATVQLQPPSRTHSIENVRTDAASIGMLPLYKIPSPGKHRGAALTFPKDETVQFTREWFARVMVDPKLHTAFVEYVELEHCGENIQFYQELTKLEDLVASSILAATIQEAAAYESARSAGSTHALARFLRAAVITSTGLQADSDPSAASNIQPASSVLITLPPLPHTLVPHGLRQRYIDIFSTFIVAGSPQEINVTDATRKRIAAALTPILSTASSSSHNSATNSHSPSSPPGFSDHGVDEAPPATLFNAAGDEIVDLLYRDTFKRFVAWRAKVGSSAVSIADSGSSTPSSARASYEGKRGKKDQQTADDDFEDPLGDLTPDMAMMLLAQAAIQAEQDRDSTPSSATASPSPKKKGITSFWKRKKDARGETSTGSLPGSAERSTSNLRHSSSILMAGGADSTGMPSPPMSRRSSTSSQTSNSISSSTVPAPPLDSDQGSVTSGSNFSKPTNAGRPRKLSMFNPKPTEVTPTPPVPSLSNSSIHNSHNSSPPSMSRSLSTKSISASNKSLNTSPKQKLAPLDVSTASLNKSPEDFGMAIDDNFAAKPKSAGAAPTSGWGFLSSKTPTTEKGGWFGKKGGAASGEFVSGDDAPPMPALPDHLRKPVLEARVETSVHKKRGGTLASWTSLD